MSSSLIIPQPPLAYYRRRRRSFIGIIDLRGGGSDDSIILSQSTLTTKKTKKKGKSGKRKTKSTNSSSSGSSSDDGVDVVQTSTEVTNTKDAIDGVLRTKDAATALGDAIRSRANELRQDVTLLVADTRSYSERAYDTALVSVGLALGTAGTDMDNTNFDNDGRGGKVDSVMAYYRHGHRNNDSHRRGNKDRYHDDEEEEIQQQQRLSVLLSEYFVMTHGGTHIAQCLLSLLASILGVSCLLLPSFPLHGLGMTIGGSNTDAKAFSRHILLSTTKCQLLQQTLLVAMTKHASGIIGAINLGAHQIPRAGIRDARRRIELVASDPVGQYLFYCSLLAVWIGWFGGGGNGTGRMGEYVSKVKGDVISIMNAAAITTTTTTAADSTITEPTVQLLNALAHHPPPWFLCQSSTYGIGHIVPFLILGPILLREVISVMWVCSDVLTLLSASTSGMTGAILSRVLTTSSTAMDVFMSTLISWERWRDADSFQRQRTLSLLVSRISLLLELAVGVVLLVDAAVSFWTFAFIGGPTTTATTSGNAMISGHYPFRSMLGKTVCAHLYINFLLSRKKKKE
jgi:hypothetical protein